MPRVRGIAHADDDPQIDQRIKPLRNQLMRLLQRLRQVGSRQRPSLRQQKHNRRDAGRQLDASFAEGLLTLLEDHRRQLIQRVAQEDAPKRLLANAAERPCLLLLHELRN